MGIGVLAALGNVAVAIVVFAVIVVVLVVVGVVVSVFTDRLHVLRLAASMSTGLGSVVASVGVVIAAVVF